MKHCSFALSTTLSGGRTHTHTLTPQEGGQWVYVCDAPPAPWRMGGKGHGGVCTHTHTHPHPLGGWVVGGGSMLGVMMVSMGGRGMCTHTDPPPPHRHTHPPLLTTHTHTPSRSPLAPQHTHTLMSTPRPPTHTHPHTHHLFK
jgi:hypothetical protein